MNKKSNKLFIVQKFIKASNLREALRKEKLHEVDEIFVDQDWKRNNIEIVESTKVVGFKK